jgi:serine/threonine protein kinase
VDLVSPTLTRVRHIFLSSLGSVYLGKDIRTGAEVALKIGRADHSPSRLSHEYQVYQKTAGSIGISSVRWYGKEGPYEVLVLEYLGTSLGDLISAQQFDHRKTFFFASQMVR